MKRLVYLLVLFPTLAIAQDNLLWKITSKQSKKVSYLFGSIHSNDSLLNTFDKTWWSAFKSCDVFAGEVNASDVTEMMEVLKEAGMKDTTLSDLYTEQELDRVRNYLLSKVDAPMAIFLMRMKPFYIMAALMQIPESEGPYTQVMDLRLQTIALEQGMKVIGLETNKEQSASISSVSLKEQADMLLEFVDSEKTVNEDLIELEKYYHMQKLDAMLMMTLKIDSPLYSEKMMEAIVFERNNRFVERLLPHLIESSVFCTVGALHLPGENGLIQQLRSHGYVLEPVPFKFEE